MSAFPSPRRFFLAALAYWVLASQPALAQGPKLGPKLGPGVPAPELDKGTEWLGVKEPLTLKELRGKFVLLDFWTLC
jgi:hypothetical protein